jgi:hypothetical protein
VKVLPYYRTSYFHLMGRGEAKVEIVCQCATQKLTPHHEYLRNTGEGITRRVTSMPGAPLPMEAWHTVAEHPNYEARAAAYRDRKRAERRARRAS